MTGTESPAASRRRRATSEARADPPRVGPRHTRGMGRAAEAWKAQALLNTA